jgi:hypothetical protein
VNGDTIPQGATTVYRWRLAGSQAEDPHYYQLHIWGPGIDTLLKTRDTSLSVPALPGFQNGEAYSWRVWIKDEYTSVTSQDTFQFVYGGGVAGVAPAGSTPEGFRLEQNYPNPFNPNTTIRFSTGTSGRVVFTVVNILGQVVATPVDDIRHAGSHEFSFDASSLASGVYLYRMSAADGFHDMKRMIVAK